jgi:hypothetical protein
MRPLLPVCILFAACGGSPDDSTGGACPAMDSTDAGELSALAAERCNVPGTMGKKNWYLLSAMLPGGNDVVQVELWPERGAFRGGPVQPGTYTLSGDDLSFATCGVCLRALGDKGLPTEREYFAIAGTVEVTAVGPTADAPFVAKILEASFAEVDTRHIELAEGCTTDLASAKISGLVVPKGGGGGGSGGGGGAGTGGCATTIGD